MLRSKKILVPVDFSEASVRALDLAVEVAEASGGSLTVLHVGLRPTHFAPGMGRRRRARRSGWRWGSDWPSRSRSASNRWFGRRSRSRCRGGSSPARGIRCAALGPAARNLDPSKMGLCALDEKVGAVRTDEVETILPRAPLSEACRKLPALRAGPLPVVHANGRLRGILSVTDVRLEAVHRFEVDGG